MDVYVKLTCRMTCLFELIPHLGHLLFLCLFNARGQSRQLCSHEPAILTGQIVHALQRGIIGVGTVEVLPASKLAAGPRATHQGLVADALAVG